MDPQSPLLTPIKKKKYMAKKLQKLLKQQQLITEPKDFQPGKVQIMTTNKCKIKVVNFFGDIHTEVYCLQTSPNHENVAVGCSNGDIKVYNIYEGRILMMGNTSRLSGFPNTSIRWNPKFNNLLVASNCDGTIKWYDIQNEIAYSHHQSDFGYLCSDFSCDGTKTFFGNQKHELQIYDEKTKKQVQKYLAGHIDNLNPNHTNRIFCVKGLRNDPNLFFSGGWDASVRLWDIRVPQNSVRKFGGPMVSSDSLDLKDNVLLSGNYSTKDIVQFWDFNSGSLIKTLDIKEEATSTAYCFSASYSHLSKHSLSAVGLSGVNKIKIFEKDEWIGEVEFQGTPLCLSFYRFNEKDFLVASGVQGTIYAIKVKVLEDKN